MLTYEIFKTFVDSYNDFYKTPKNTELDRVAYFYFQDYLTGYASDEKREFLETETGNLIIYFAEQADNDKALQAAQKIYDSIEVWKNIYKQLEFYNNLALLGRLERADIRKITTQYYRVVVLNQHDETTTGILKAFNHVLETVTEYCNDNNITL